LHGLSEGSRVIFGIAAREALVGRIEKAKMLLFFLERFEFLATGRGLDRNRWDCEHMRARE